MTEIQENATQTVAPTTLLKKSKISTSLSIWREVALNLLVIVLLSVFGFLVVFQFIPAVNSLQSSRSQIDHIIEKHYIGEIPEEQAFTEGQLKGYVAALGDPYSDYMTGDDNDDFKDNINERYEGIGIRFEQTNQDIVVLEVLPDGPAQKVGILAGDILARVDDQPVAKYDLDEIADMILGESGTEVTLTVLRQEREISFDLVRQKIFTPLVSLEAKRNVGIISISSFGDGIDQEMLAVANEIEDNPEIDRLVLDLRDNTGGILDSAIDISSYFLPPEVVAVKEKTKTGTIEDKTTKKEISLKDYPLIILVNKYTASASEIVAGALRDHRQTPLIGQKTYGKGVVQQIFELNDGGYFRLTVAEWFTPQDNQINEVGLEPDIQLRSSSELLGIILENYNWETRSLSQISS